MTPEPSTPTPPCDLDDLTAAQLGFTVSGRTLFALTLVWEQRLEVFEEGLQRLREAGMGDTAAADGVNLAIRALGTTITETRALMSASIPAPTVGLS